MFSLLYQEVNNEWYSENWLARGSFNIIVDRRGNSIVLGVLCESINLLTLYELQSHLLLTKAFSALFQCAE